MDTAAILAILVKFLPLLSPVLVWGLKWAVSFVGNNAKIPAWAKPVLSAIIGAVISYLTTGDVSAEVSIPAGAIAGMAGSKLRDLFVGRPVSVGTTA